MRIGLTGHYASGKSFISTLFEDLGSITIDTDIIARNIVKPGSIALHNIVANFGNTVLNEDKTLNRRILGSLVFNDQKKLTLLNSIMHPEILKVTLKKTENSDTVYIINVPLLFQTNFKDYMNKIIIVTAEREQLVTRGIKRDNLSEEEINLRLKNQISINRFLKYADYIIDNSRSIENTKKQVIEIWNSIKMSMK